MKHILLFLLTTSAWAQTTATTTVKTTAKTCPAGSSFTQQLANGTLICTPVTGTPGPAGSQGIQGIQGIQGPVGPQGPPGSGTGGFVTPVMGQLICPSSNGTISYTCALNPALQTYTPMVIVLVADVACPGACTLDAGAGVRAIKKGDGTTDSPVTKGPHVLVYTGVWELVV